MRKIYSLVLMAAVLLWSTNGRAAEPVAMLNGSQTFESVQAAIDAAQSGDEISLIADVTTSAPLWLGTTGLDGAKKSLTLDLAGYSITSQADVLHTFVVSHGALKVLNSVPGQGGMYNTCAQDTSSAVIYLHGTWERGINPRTCAESELYTFLTVEEGVNLYANGPQGSAIVVKEVSDREASKLLLGILYNTDVYWNDKAWTKGVANGVRVDVKGQIYAQKYGVKVDGNLRYPHPDAECTNTKSLNHRNQYFPTLGAIQLADTAYVPFVHIYPSAVIDQTKDNKNGAAAYVSGYSHWLVEGKCNGATGMYIKSGEVTLDDATITSAWEGEVNSIVGTNGKTGFESGGHSIVIESVTQYPGETVLLVDGDSKIETGAIGGAALLEIVTTLDKTTKVDSIVVKGGSFSGGEDGYSMVISKETVEDPTADVIVYGTNVTGDVNIGGIEDISDILAENTHTTVVHNSDGTATVIVSTGDAPQGVSDWTTVQAGDDVNWIGYDKIIIDSDFNLGELQVINGDAEHLQQFVITNNSTFKVDKLIMNEYAQIVVEAGSRLIVTGEQGINAPSVNNIVLKAGEGNSAYFLFNPAVTSNRHPNATVEFTSKSYRESSENLAWQRFGIPTYSALKSMTTQYENANVATALASFNYATNQWVNFGMINAQGEAQGLDQMNNPFNYYQMLHNTQNMGTAVTMKGELFGNESPELLVRSNSWNGFANSYMAPIDGERLINMIPNTVDKAFYLYDLNAVQATYEPVTLIDIEDQGGIQPMQPFLIRNPKAAANVIINYAAAIYNPAMNIQPNNAPARRSATRNITKAKMIVKGENCIDRVTVAEDADFTAEFDNGYDAVKYMNDGINMYVSGNENMSVFATDNLENTYVGLQTVNGGTYTMEFAKVQGEALTLIDHETGKRIAMTEGNVYEFTANGTNDYRFEIVKSANAPTAIENTEAVKSAKGVYTITGQFVGEMNVWNTLPAGIYVVNGEKRVK